MATEAELCCQDGIVACDGTAVHWPLRLCLMRVSGHQSSPHQRIIVSTKYDPAQANCLRPAQPRLGDQEPPRPLSFPPMGAETNFLIFLFTAALLNHGRLNNNFQTG